MVVLINHGSYRDTGNFLLSQVVRVFSTANIITDFDAGFPIANPSTQNLPCPLNSIAFAEDVRLVSQSYQFSFSASLMNASGMLNAAPMQYYIGTNATIKKKAVDLNPNLFIGPAIGGVRQIWTPRDVDDTIYRKQADYACKEYSLLYFTGLPAGTTFGRLDVYSNYEIIPNADYMSIV